MITGTIGSLAYVEGIGWEPFTVGRVLEIRRRTVVVQDLATGAILVRSYAAVWPEEAVTVTAGSRPDLLRVQTKPYRWAGMASGVWSPDNISFECKKEATCEK